MVRKISGLLLLLFFQSCGLFVQEEEEYEFDIDLAFHQFLEGFPNFEGVPDKQTTFFYYSKTGCPTCIVNMQDFLKNKTSLKKREDFYVIYNMPTPKEGTSEVDLKIHDLLDQHYPILYDEKSRLSKMGVAPPTSAFIITSAGSIDTMEYIHYTTAKKMLSDYFE